MEVDHADRLQHVLWTIQNNSYFLGPYCSNIIFLGICENLIACNNGGLVWVFGIEIKCFSHLQNN